MNIDNFSQSDCYKQRVIELKKANPDHSLISLLDSKIKKFDNDNNQQEMVIFNASFGKSEPMQDCIVK